MPSGHCEYAVRHYRFWARKPPHVAVLAPRTPPTRTLGPYDPRVSNGVVRGQLIDERSALVRLLQDAHAGELAAAYAYRAHWKSLRRRAWESAEIHRIEDAEWHHRSMVADMLTELHERPRRRRELLMGSIGRFFGLLCYVTGWFGPMYAAGRLEAANVKQYEQARTWATSLAYESFVDRLDGMIAEEVRHEEWFGERVRDHWLLPIVSPVLGWRPPAPQESTATG
jgi:demethoxyubiquinone hydroxylase (CLK1/Coq7/Cat5 family)